MLGHRNPSSNSLLCFYRMSELIEIRGRSPWLWPDIIYNMSSYSREFSNCLKILHGFTNKVNATMTYHVISIIGHFSYIATVTDRFEVRDTAYNLRGYENKIKITLRRTD